MLIMISIDKVTQKFCFVGVLTCILLQKNATMCPLLFKVNFNLISQLSYLNNCFRKRLPCFLADVPILFNFIFILSKN